MNSSIFAHLFHIKRGGPCELVTYTVSHRISLKALQLILPHVQVTTNQQQIEKIWFLSLCTLNAINNPQNTCVIVINLLDLWRLFSKLFIHISNYISGWKQLHVHIIWHWLPVVEDGHWRPSPSIWLNRRWYSLYNILSYIKWYPPLFRCFCSIPIRTVYISSWTLST